MTDDLLHATGRALFEQTARVDDATRRTTRSRIMASLHARQRRRRSRIALLLPIAALLVGSTALAAGGGGLRWQSVTRALGIGHPASSEDAPIATPRPRLQPAPVAPRHVLTAAAPSEPPTPPALPTHAKPALAAPEPSIAPSVAQAPVAESPPPDPTLELYRAAHRLHFSGGDAAAALGAWDRYLREAPRGRFALEARYNRAICLVRLGRTAEARRAFEPFARGAYGEYRRANAQALLDAMGDAD